VIEIEGDVYGDLVDVYYIPSDPYLWGPPPDHVIVVASPLHANLTPRDGHTHVQVSLPDNTMLTTPSTNQWHWMVYEVGKHTTYHWSLDSEPKVITYAASRPRRAMEVRP
jgi:hypothetical protein